ncbi:MAG: LCP family protein [Actinobacteria bacterium]|nr:LCP family protein [Actinomycetota bacterium]
MVSLSDVKDIMSEAPLPTPNRRGPSRWFKVTVITVLALANLAALGALWAIRTGQSVLAGADTDSEVADVLDTASGGDLTFLILGSDTREGLDDLENFGAFGGARGDVVILVRVDSETSTAQMLSIPRDLWVEIPGHGENRINAAYALGGSSLMVETIRENLNVEINHYVEIDFVGFQALVDELGGIEIAFPYPARDTNSGLDVEAGTQVLDGEMALAYARSRHYQEYKDGSWVSVDANDIGRTARQQEVIRAIVAELKSPSSIAEAGEIAGALARHMTIDTRLAEASVATLAWDYRGILLGGIDGVTLPTEGRTIDGASVVVAKEPEAGAMLANFRSGRALTEQPLRLQVLNGNGVGGAATDMSRRLESDGFLIADIGDAESSDYAQTTIIVPEGSHNGLLILDSLGFGVVMTGPVGSGYDAVVIVGADAA